MGERILHGESNSVQKGYSKWCQYPMEANKNYGKAILPLLFKYGNHPVFMSKCMGRFLHPEGSDDWYEVIIVRYRSRKDLLRMAADAAILNLGGLKFSAIDKTQVFPVKAKLHAMPVKLSITMLLIIFIQTQIRW